MLEQLSEEEQIRISRREQRRRQMQLEKRRQMQRRKTIRKILPYAVGIMCIFFIFIVGSSISHRVTKEKENIKNSETINETDGTDIQMIQAADDSGSSVMGGRPESVSASDSLLADSAGKQNKVYSATATADTRQIGEEVISKHALLIDLETDRIVAQRDAKSRINPASMTKILTILVAAEHVKDLDDTFTMTLEITDYAYVNDCSSVGFLDGEVVTVRDLFYGTILPSGADAAVGLATYVAGDQETFVEMMNEKLKKLGLSETAHMTNCVGLYDENHYCSVYDMAMILEAAIDNELCREVLSAHTYTTSKTEQHPEGITESNWFLRRIEDKDTGGEVLCAKTGYVVQSGNCAASYGVDNSGKGFICVTADANSSWRCIYDHVALYKEFAAKEALQD